MKRNFAEKMRYYINIGTNLGDLGANVARAVAEIRARLSVAVRESTPVYSEAWGYESEHGYMNVGAAFDTEECPVAVLRELRGIEVAMGSASHRNADGSYADRIVDIDVIAIDELVIDTPELTVPHPRMEQRDFVLAPLAELAPEWRHPVIGVTARELLERLSRGRDAADRP